MDIVERLRDMQVQCAEAADEIERIRKTMSQMVSHCDERAKGWDAPKGNGNLDCEHGARHEARAIAAQLREIAGLDFPANAGSTSNA